MASIADIRTGLKANLTAAGFTNVNLYTVSNPNPPVIELDLDVEGEAFDLASNRGLALVPMIVRAVFAEGEGAAITLDTYLDGAASTDVKAAVESDRTLGGAAQNVHCKQAQYRKWKSDTTGGLLIGAEWSVDVYADGTS